MLTAQTVRLNTSAVVLALCLAAPVWAGFEEGVAADNRGDYATALKEFRLRAERGNAETQSQLGFLYRNGRGVAEDFQEALKWFLRAAEQGNSTAQLIHCFEYRVGTRVPQDYQVAIKWCRKLAELGDAGGQLYLAKCIFWGKGCRKTTYSLICGETLRLHKEMQ